MLLGEAEPAAALMVNTVVRYQLIMGAMGSRAAGTLAPEWAVHHCSNTTFL